MAPVQRRLVFTVRHGLQKEVLLECLALRFFAKRGRMKIQLASRHATPWKYCRREHLHSASVYLMVKKSPGTVQTGSHRDEGNRNSVSHLVACFCRYASTASANVSYPPPTHSWCSCLVLIGYASNPHCWHSLMAALQSLKIAQAPNS